MGDILAQCFPPSVTLVAVEGPNVTVRCQPMSAGQRGQVLMDLEDKLRATGMPQAIVWHEPLGDRNSLRNLRGIEVKG